MSDKKKKKAEAALEALKKGPHRRVRVSDCAPNDWNPNRMTQEIREKLLAGLKLTKDQGGHTPPIVVRKHPDQSIAKYQIIDGFHRWDIYRSEELDDRIDAFILDVDTKTAMILTDTLNYLRGSPDPDGYAQYMQRLLNENHMTPAEAALYLPATSDEITDLLANYDLKIEQIEVPSDTVAGEADAQEVFVELKFFISTTQAEVVERELARISKLLQGKNVRGRALEYMAVNSSQTPIENFLGEGEAALTAAEIEDDRKSVEKLSKLKAKLKNKSKKKRD